MTIHIGYAQNSYLEKRSIINRVPGVMYHYVPSTPCNFGHCLNPDELEHVVTINDDVIGLAHFFNKINFGKTPWISTFGTQLPRFGRAEAIKLGINVLSKDTCRKIIATSTCAHNIQLARLEGSNYADRIAQKLTVLHPPQACVPNNISRFEHLEHIRFVFVGEDFFRKGGKEIIDTLLELRREFDCFSLLIISSFVTGYNVTQSTHDDMQALLNTVYANKHWIEVYSSIPNRAVLQLLAQCHVGLLPTFAEPYGYSVLEMQAAGIPVITTSIRALPEINNSIAGWLLNTENTAELSLTSSKQDVLRVRQRVAEELYATIRLILNNPIILKDKSALSSYRIKKHHDEIAYAKKLKEIYIKAL